ncbi:MAG: rod shape-determining protein MreC [Planctomycetota bacterium]|jgi:cell shape-determining protein MreC
MSSKRVKTFKPGLLIFFFSAAILLVLVPQSFSDKCQLAFVSVFRRPLAFGRSLSASLFRPQEASAGVSDSQYRRLRNFQANTALLLKQEREKVEKLMKVPDRTVWGGASFVVADIITSTISKTCGEFVVNRGAEDGLVAGQFVLGESSIVGVVESADSHVAKVKLITDPTSKIPVSIANLDVKRIMKGRGNDAAEIGLLASKYKIEIGDIVWARKKPGFLDTAVIVGTIAHCSKSDENPGIWEIAVSPACNIEELNSVIVVVANPRKDG